MITEVDFYLNGTIEDDIFQLTNVNSPIALKEKILDFYRLKSKRSELSYTFTYCAPDRETILKQELHTKTQLILKFQSGSNLHCSGINLNLESIAMLKDMMKHFAAEDIPFYTTLTDESGKETFLLGYNPIEGIEIRNLGF